MKRLWGKVKEGAFGFVSTDEPASVRGTAQWFALIVYCDWAILSEISEHPFIWMFVLPYVLINFCLLVCVADVLLRFAFRRRLAQRTLAR